MCTGGKGVGRGNYHCDASDWLQVQVTMLLYDLLCMIMLLVLQCLALKGSTSGLGSFLIQMPLNKIFDRKYRLN